MAFVKVFLDEAGFHKESVRFVIAGYIGTVERWDKFVPAWNAVLKPFGHDWFHMADCEALCGDYEDLGSDGREKLVTVLGYLTAVLSECGIASIWPTASYRKHIFAHAQNSQFTKSVFLHVYTAAAFHALSGLARAARGFGFKPADTEIMFASQPELSAVPRDQIIRAAAKHGFPEPVWRPSRDFAPLQAADMLAWWFQRFGDPRVQTRKRHGALKSRVLHSPVSDEDIKGLAAKIEHAAKTLAPLERAQREKRKRRS